MNVTCSDRDSIFEDGTTAQWAALEAHAATCPACAEEVRSWKALSVAAAELRDYSPSPALWSRIETALAANAVPERALSLQEKLSAWLGFSLSWQLAAVSAFAVLLLVSGGLIYRHQTIAPTQKPVSSTAQQDPLLKTKALDDVEKAETAYVQAIDKLAADARPQLDKPETSLMANYREKLQVLDSAIDDLRAQAGQNPSNAHLRYQLLAMYQEKQKTLEDVLEARR
jgi:anti-sigma-K factor RskA